MNSTEQHRMPGWPGDVAGMQTDDVDFEALSHVLGNTCCWGGQTRRFYSLAQRTVTVSGAVENLGGMTGEVRRVLSLHALLAEAWRAWLRDDSIAGLPAKASDKRGRDVAAVQRTILEAAGVEPDLPVSWAQALGLTQRMAEAAAYRDLSGAGLALRTGGPLFPPLKERVRPLAPDRAARQWLERFEALRAPGGGQSPGSGQSPGGEANDGSAG